MVITVAQDIDDAAGAPEEESFQVPVYIPARRSLPC